MLLQCSTCISTGGLIEGRRVGFSIAWESLARSKRRVAAMPLATDLASGREIWLQQGPIGRAVRASIGMPGLFSPTRHDDQWLIDGGLVNPIPVSLARALGADIIIAVDLNSELVGRRFSGSDIELAASTTPPAVPAQAPQWLKDAVGPILQRVLQAGPDFPSYFEVLANSLNIMRIVLPGCDWLAILPMCSCVQGSGDFPGSIFIAQRKPLPKGWHACRPRSR